MDHRRHPAVRVDRAVRRGTRPGRRASPTACEARYVGTADGRKLRVVTLWESKAHADRFFAETLGPALAKVLGPEPSGKPTIIGIEPQRTYSASSSG